MAKIKESSEVLFHELGESLSTAASQIQDELDRYPKSWGSFHIDSLELSIPVAMRIDSFGQVFVEVDKSTEKENAGGNVTLKIRPYFGDWNTPEIYSDQSVKDLDVLTDKEIQVLEEHRIFTVNDLLRLTRNPTGRKAFENIGLGDKLDKIINRSVLMGYQEMDDELKIALVKLGVDSLEKFTDAKKDKLSKQLLDKYKIDISQTKIAEMQKNVKSVLKKKNYSKVITKEKNIKGDDDE